jgi:TM2 domain-containing membrane protein YozV
MPKPRQRHPRRSQNTVKPCGRIRRYRGGPITGPCWMLFEPEELDRRLGRIYSLLNTCQANRVVAGRGSETTTAYARRSTLPVVPGLGQMYAGESRKGAAVLVAAIVVASLNLGFVLAFAAAGPDTSTNWGYWIPRIGHDVVALWSVVFWAWAVVDAYRTARRRRNGLVQHASAVGRRSRR